MAQEEFGTLVDEQEEFGTLVEEQEEFGTLVDSEKPEKDDLTLGQTAGSLAIDVGGSLGTQALGYSLAPATGGLSLVIPFLGGIASSVTAQMTAEGKDFSEISYGRALSSGLLNAFIPGSSITKFARPIAREAAKGAAIGAADVTIQSVVDEKRLPTKEELALGVGIGTGLGTGIGAAMKPGIQKKFTKRVGEGEGDIFGMPIDKVDEAILTSTAQGKQLRDVVKEATGREFTPDEIMERAKNLELDIIAQKKRNDNLSIREGWFGVDGVFSTLTPTLALGPKVRNTIFETKNQVRRINNLARKLPSDIQNAIQTRSFDTKAAMNAKEQLGRDATSFLDGKPMTEELKKQAWSENLVKYRELEDELYEKFSKILVARKKGGKIDDFFKGLESGDEDFLIDKLHRSAADKASPRQYKALIAGKDSKGRQVYFPKPEEMKSSDYDRLFNEIKNWQVKNNDLLVSEEKLLQITALKGDQEAKKYFTLKQLVGEDGKSGKIKEHMEYLAKESRGSLKLRNVLPGNVERKLGNHVPGVFERNLLGEVKDVGMRIQLGIDELGESLAKFDGDKTILTSLKKQNLVKDFPEGDFVKPLRLPNLQTGDKLYVTRETDRALSIINSSDIVEEINDPLLKAGNHFLKTAVTASKGVKVILNVPSYAVNFLSGQVTMAGMGVWNPIKGAANFMKGFSNKDIHNAYTRGARLAVNESSLMRNIGNFVKKPTAENRKRYLDTYDEYVRNGIMNGNIAAEDIMESFRGLSKEGVIGKASKIYESGFNFFGKMYSVTDIAARASVYEANKNALRKIFPRFKGPANSRELERVAAAITNDTYQNYDYVSRVVRKLSRIGVMPQFVTFTAEFARNMYHQGNLARKLLTGDVDSLARQYGISKSVLRDVDKKALFGEGAKRTTTLSTLLAAATFVPNAINKSNGIDAETDNDLRKILPSWQKNKSLIFLRDKDNPDNIAAANVSYIAPHAIIASALQAGLDGKDQTSVIGFLTDEFVGTGTFINQEMMRAIDNRTGRGKQITYSDDDFEKATDLVKYFISATFTPGQYREYEKFMDSINNSETARYNTKEVLLRQVGLRLNKYNLEEMTKYRLQDLANTESKIKGEYSNAYKRFTGEYTGDVVTADQLEEIYQKSNEGSRNAYEKMKDVYKAMTRSFGFSNEKAIDVLSSSGSNVSTKNSFRIIKDLDHQDIDRVPKNTVQERYEKLFGEETNVSAYSNRQILDKIKSLRKINPVEYKSMLNYYRSQQRAERSNLSAEEKLLKKMSVADRADAILSLGYTTHEKRKDLKRKGIWTKDVDMVLRSMQ